MLPTSDQIRDAAYDRWQRGGSGHGRDRDDWLHAEQDLLFALNYRVVARVGPRVPSDNGAAQPSKPGAQSCRFCEQTSPRVRFSGLHGRGPTLCGNGALAMSVPDECDDCRQHFDESIGANLSRLILTIRDGRAPGDPLPRSLATLPFVPIVAFKGLTRMALACLPRAELAAFEAAIEWINNPDHDFDAPAFGPLSGVLHLYATPFPAPWAALSLRGNPDVRMPYSLFHLGDGCAMLQVSVPLCGRDDDLDGQTSIVPRAAHSLLSTRRDDPIVSATIALASSRPTREVRLANSG
jgi:Protein of unknown function (DUF2934)